MSKINDLHRELEALDDLYNPFIVILDFVFALEPGDFTKKGAHWVYNPNFVTLTAHSQRAHNVTICLRGDPKEFAQAGHLPLTGAMAGYSRCKVETVLQVDAALAYIRTAHDLFEKGPTRIKRIRRIVET